MAALVFLGVGLAAVIIKNLLHFIREAVALGFRGETIRFYMFILPLIGVLLGAGGLHGVN